MHLSEYANCDATALAGLIAKGEVSAKEVALCARQAIEKVNPEINAVIETYQDRIEELDDSQLATGPLHGVPFLIKDTGNNEAGRKCERGSRLLEGFSPSKDSHLMQLIRQSGLNTLGRTNVPEFCVAGTTENALYGNTATPWRKGYSAGGSSGGAAAAVAAGIVPLAHGSDIAGSIRIPASLCGGVGLKPSRGRVSYGPGLAEGGHGMAQNLVQSRTVRDTALALDCLSIPQPGDPFLIQQPSRLFVEDARGGSRPLRIAYWNQKLLTEMDVHPEVATEVETAAKQLESMGHRLEEARPEYDSDVVLEHFLAVWFVGYDKYFEALAQAAGRELDTTTLEPMTLQIYQAAREMNPLLLLDALDYWNKVRRNFGDFFSRYDIWLTPTTAMPSEPWGKYNQSIADSTLDAISYVRLTEKPVQFCMPYNVTGFPAISLPLSQTSDNLPIGIQLGAAHCQEAMLLQLAADLEQAMPWHKRIPPLHVSY